MKYFHISATLSDQAKEKVVPNKETNLFFEVKEYIFWFHIPIDVNWLEMVGNIDVFNAINVSQYSVL